jgi:hypothetical protein
MNVDCSDFVTLDVVCLLRVANSSIDTANAVKLQESGNQARYSDLFKLIVFHVLNWLLVLGR